MLREKNRVHGIRDSKSAILAGNLAAASSFSGGAWGIFLSLVNPDVWVAILASS